MHHPVGSRLIGLLFFGVLISTTALAQSDAAERRYRNGVRLVQEGNYSQARAELAPLTQRRSGGVAPYAHYYVALADYREKKYNEARLMLRQLIERFPEWNKLEEAYYLLASASLEAGLYEDGLEAATRVTQAALRPELAKLETLSYARITDLNRLKALHKAYPDNRSLALALIDLIQRTSSDRNDLALSDRLTNRFGVPAPAVRPAQDGATQTRPERIRNRGYYNVGILFPFRLPELSPDRTGRNNQDALDLYNGMKLAKAKLQAEGIAINLFAYDVDNDTTQVRDLINNASFQQNDLLYGPLYADPNRLMTQYAERSGIPLINPIATSSELVANQQLAFLAQPSLRQQASQTVAYARSLSPVRKVAIYYSTSRRDSSLAALYAEECKRLNFQITEIRKLTNEVTAGVTLTEPSRPGHIFLAASDEKSGPRLLQVLTARRVVAPLIASASAFDLEKNTLSTFNRPDLYLLHPEYVDARRPEVQQFRQEYLNQRNLIPSVYAYQGYDMLLFFGRMLARNQGQLPARPVLKALQDDYLLAGFDYTLSNENAAVSIVKFSEGQFVKVNE